MKVNYDERAEVLARKLRGMSPNKIADDLHISVAAVHSHDREIKKAMAKGDAESLAAMSPDELKFAETAISQMLPYMRKSLDAIGNSNKTLQSMHTTALDVAEKIFNLIDKKLKEDVSIKELVTLTDLFATTYATLYNKNGIQIVNLLSDGSSHSTTDTLATLDGLRADRKKHLDSLNTIEAEVE